MSFQAKRLRVQLPCGDATVIDEAAQQAGAGGFCRLTTCLFDTGFCALPSRICFWPSRCGWFTCEWGTCGGFTILRCPAGTARPVDPGTMLVDPEHLPALREALEAQLKEVEKAEQALEEHGGEK